MNWPWGQSQFEQDATTLLNAIKNALVIPNGKGGYQPILPVIMAKLDTINQQQQQLLTQGDKIMSTLADVQALIATLTADVAADATVEQSAITLLNGLTKSIGDLSAQLAAAIASGDPVALQAAADALAAQNTALASNTAALAAAVTANTPAAPPAPAPAAP